MSKRSSSKRVHGRISIDPNVCHGKACIKGTRIPVHIILDLMAAGETLENIHYAYPQLKPADIRACLSYAAALAREEVVDLEVRELVDEVPYRRKHVSPARRTARRVRP